MTAQTKSATVSPWEKLGISTLPISSIHDALDLMWASEKKHTLCLIGDTGVGKTPIVHQWATKHNGFIRVLNFGHMSPEEVSMAMFNEDGSQFDFVPPAWLVELNEQAKKGPAILFMDEWNRGDKALVNCFFTLTDERRIHNYTLHDNVLVVAAMNPSDGTYLVNSAERDHAIRKRLDFVFVTPDLAGWLTHAKNSNYHPLVVDFVRAQSNLFYDAGARDAGRCFPCPANWEKVSHLMNAAEKLGGTPKMLSSVTRSLASGLVGHVAANKFMEFVADKNTVIQPSEVLETYLKGGRRRVAALLGMELQSNGTLRKLPEKPVRADVLSELNKGVSMTLYSERPDVEDIHANLCQYLIDLPGEIFMSFVTEMRAAAETTPGVKDYTAALSSYFQRNQEYRTKMAEVQRAYRAINNAVNPTSTPS